MSDFPASLIDTHAHLDDKRFEPDSGEVIKRAEEAGVRTIINIGTDLCSSKAAIRLATEYDALYATVGIHPHEAKEATDEVLIRLEELSKDKKVLAIGEVGLDYHYDHSPRSVQQDIFRQFIRMAMRVGLPIVVHSRDADRDTLRILKEERAGEAGGVFHCFSGDAKMAGEILDLGFYISFTGVITFKNFSQAETIRMIPKERLLIETDCPYLAPVPKRGKRNEPSFLVHIASKMARILGCSVEEIAQLNRTNAKKLLKKLP